MITVSIGGMAVPAENASEGWVNQMIAEARKRHMPLCVQVTVQEPGAQVILSTPECGGGGGSGRMPNDIERRVLEAWSKRGLASGQFHPGDLRAFLNELSRLV